MNFFDLHRHDEHSLFDGFGKPSDLAKLAKEKGYKALGISNHGTISGLVQHYNACNSVGIKPVMGCEVYFQPVFNKENPQRKSYHLNLFVKNLKGYKNLCHIMTYANKNQFYYKPIVDFKLLEKYSDGLICTTACIASMTSQAIVKNNKTMAIKALKKFQSIFGKDLYVEIQPYKIDNKRTQENTDYILMGLARKLKIKCILTSDSHFGSKEDFDTYCKMHEIGKTTLNVKETYGERYMPTEYEIVERFAKMYKGKIKNAISLAEKFVDNMSEIYDKVEDGILDELPLILPKLNDVDSKNKLKSEVAKGLKQKGKWTPKYKKRCLEELDVIFYHGFEDYFLIVQDYVNFARKSGIAIGKGRGSVCNCLVAYAIGLTDVDSIRFNLDFSRFMRKDKKSLPDVDTDMETDRRQEVINYVVNKYPGKAVQICSYGQYNIDNLINDLSSVCGLKTTKEVDSYEANENKKIIAELKRYVREFEIDGKLNIEALQNDDRTIYYNDQYDNILKHFCKMYGKIRYLGKHAAGVAVVGTDISDYTALICRDKKKGLFTSCYDKDDLEHINCVKFDMLGLKTVSELKELEEISGHKVTEQEEEIEEIYEEFRKGNTEGIFQMEKSAPKKILDMIQCDNINDVIAVNALNRPAPLQLKMHETYAHNKLHEADKNTPFYQYTKETYGTMLYQEQTVEVAQKVGHLSSQQSFDMLKIMKKAENLNKPEYIPIIEQMRNDFFKGCRSEGLTKAQTEKLWASSLIYGFNKGHATGYALISIDQMYYKIHYPAVFWYVKIKFALNDNDIFKYSECAVKDDAVVLLPHVNGTSKTSLKKMDGEFVIQQGLSVLKGVGEKAADYIQEEKEAHGDFINYDDFYDRCKSRSVTSRVINILEEQGALEFNKKRYYSRVVKYNSSLLAR